MQQCGYEATDVGITPVIRLVPSKPDYVIVPCKMPDIMYVLEQKRVLADK